MSERDRLYQKWWMLYLKAKAIADKRTYYSEPEAK